LRNAGMAVPEVTENKKNPQFPQNVSIISIIRNPIGISTFTKLVKKSVQIKELIVENIHWE
jgi:hypothetical protein